MTEHRSHRFQQRICWRQGCAAASRNGGRYHNDSRSGLTTKPSNDCDTRSGAARAQGNPVARPWSRPATCCTNNKPSSQTAEGRQTRRNRTLQQLDGSIRLQPKIRTRSERRLLEQLNPPGLFQNVQFHQLLCSHSILSQDRINDLSPFGPTYRLHIERVILAAISEYVIGHEPEFSNPGRDHR